MSLAAYRGKPFSVEVQVFTIGPVSIIALPEDVFVDYGLSIRRSTPFEYTIPVSHANESHNYWYVPTTEAAESGDYESTKNRYVPGEGDKLIETAIRILNELHESD